MRVIHHLQRIASSYITQVNFIKGLKNEHSNRMIRS